MKVNFVSKLLFAIISFNLIAFSPIFASSHQGKENHYFPEKQVHKILVKSGIEEEKWPVIIESLRQKTKEALEKSGLSEMKEHCPNISKKKLKRSQTKIKKILEKDFNLNKENLAAVEQKLQDGQEILGDKFKGKLAEAAHSKEVRKAKSDLKRAKQRIDALVLRLLEKELKEQGL